MNRKRNILILALAGIVILGVRHVNADFTFGTPVNLGSVVNSSAYESAPSISVDGLWLFFASRRAAGYGNRDLWLATRPTTNDAWGEPVNLGPVVNTSYDDGGPSISFDSLTLYFYSNRSGGYGGQDIWVATRETIDDTWSEPVNLGPTINSSYHDAGPSISSGGLALYFSSRRLGGSSSKDLWATTRATKNADWSPPMNLGPVVNSSANSSPSISADGLWLFFPSDRPGGYGGRDLWLATRPTTSDAWGEQVNLGPTVNGPAKDAGPSLSVDGRTLYFNSNRPGGIGDDDIWQVSIEPVVDLNGDGIVDGADLTIIVDHWGTDEPLCDIGPTPLGDGIVDVEDLIVLAEHLFEEIPPVE